jgi:hypothetical protein
MGFDQKRLRSLISAVCDGVATEADEQELARILEGDADARREYLNYLDLHMEIERTLPSVESSDSRVARFPLMAAAVGAAAAIAVSFILFKRAPEPVSYAMIATTNSAVWNRSDVALLPGTKLAAGDFRLMQGEVGLSYGNGAEVTIGAPADFSVVSGMELFVKKGRISARVPESASGFLIRSQDMALVDIGTEFSMNIDGAGKGRVFVRKGEVVASVLGKNGATVRDYAATTGESFEIDARSSEIVAADLSGESFVEPFMNTASPLPLSEAWRDAVRKSKPLAWWRFDNEDANPLSQHGSVDIDGSASFSSATPDGVLMSEPIAGLNKSGYTIALWMQTRVAQHSTLVGLVQPGWSVAEGEPNYLSVIELTDDSNSVAGILARARSVRFLHRSPPESRTGVNVFSSRSYNLMQWHHVTAVADQTAIRIYLDGMLSQEIEHISTADDNAYQLVVGRLRPPGYTENLRPVSGNIDELTIYDRPLRSEEISAIFKASKNP